MNLYDAVEKLGLRWPSSGKLNCPLHVDKTPSLHLYGGTNSWTCFSCQETGDQYGLIAAFTGKGMAEVFRLYKPKDGQTPSKQTVDLVGPHALNQQVVRAWRELHNDAFAMLRDTFADYEDWVYLAEIEHLGEWLDCVREQITSTGMWLDEPLPALVKVRTILGKLKDDIDVYMTKARDDLRHGQYEKPERYVRDGR